MMNDEKLRHGLTPWRTTGHMNLDLPVCQWSTRGTVAGD
jgi:hypothetical protein